MIGAHYDTVKNTTGLNDNGSGVGVMLELIRLMDYYNCITKYSVLFVAFDLEELVGFGNICNDRFQLILKFTLK